MQLDPRRQPSELANPITETSKDFFTFKEKVFDYEMELLRVVAFNLQVEHPYKYLLSAVKSVGGSKHLAETAWNFINDSLKTPLCLQYKPQLIGAAILDLTAKALKVKLPGPPEKARWWFEEPPYNARSEQIDDVCDQVLSLYETSKEKEKERVEKPLDVRMSGEGFAQKLVSVSSLGK